MQRHLRSARSVFILLAVVCVTALAIPLVLRANARLAVLMPTTTELSLALYRVGLDPEALTAAGLTPGGVDDVVDDCLEFLTEYQGTIALNDMECAELKRTVDSLVRRVQG